MRFFLLLLILFSSNAFAIEVIKPQFGKKLNLKITRVETDSFGTYLFVSEDLTELTLVCANNQVYDYNKRAFFEFRNYYREVAGRFSIEENKVCTELGQFIESVQAGVTEEKPFYLFLNREAMKVEKIIYPRLDPLLQNNDIAPINIKRLYKRL
jgi:ribosomal protein S12 methylthiotransferase accessory factor YcaO